jgi:hypothetical protein
MGKTTGVICFCAFLTLVAACAGSGSKTTKKYYSSVEEGDTSEPQTTITLYPSNPSTSSVTFEFVCSKASCSFECQLDTDDWDACASPEDLTGLTAGSHTFNVRAKDSYGTVESTPATFSWTVDTTMPDTSITSYPAALSNSDTATFAFTCTELPCTYQCSMDFASWSACTSPVSYSGLAQGTHNFQVMATDAAGNTDASPAAYIWEIDSIAPVSTIYSGPQNPTLLTSAQFLFGCNEAGCTFECNLDSTGWSACTSPVDYSGVSLGSHTFSVRATDLAGNVESAPPVYDWVVYSDPPETFITSQPSNPSQANVAFAFACDQSWCSFACQLDASAWAACLSPVSYSGLSSGSHTFSVRATNSAGNVDATPPSVTWTVDTTVPDTSITSNPAALSNSDTATFAFTCTELPCTYQCSIDFASWSACTSPASYSGLAQGTHNFQVRATDLAGNTDATPAAYVWTIDSIPPDTTIYSGPTNPSESISATFLFGCNEASCTFKCNLDSAGWSACTSPVSYSSLSVGSHTFNVQATDAAGNVDPTSAVFTWLISIPPDTTITSQPTNPSGPDVSFGFTCNQSPCSYQCQIDSNPWAACTSPQSYSGLSAAVHSFYVRAANANGVDPTPALFNWTVRTNFWLPTSTGTNVPDARIMHTAVWTGTEMIVWGGFVDGVGMVNTGARYNPVTDSWSSTSTGANCPVGRYNHTAVWAGTQMIVWGGYIVSGASYTYTNGGGRYTPATDSWLSTTTSNAPTGRGNHVAVWTGSTMIVWGGLYDCGETVCWPSTGGIYDPGADSWQATNTTNAPSGRQDFTAVWTGSKMIVWGGDSDVAGTVWYNTGGVYNPSSDLWLPTSTTNAPLARQNHTAAWTGTEMIIWGGAGPGYPFMNSGGQYNPALDSWTPTSTGTNLPTARLYHTAVWSGTEMIVWGGMDTSANNYANTGGKYNPTTDSWTATAIDANTPELREEHTAVWTGTSMIVWSGVYEYMDPDTMMPVQVFYNDGGTYFP